MPALFAAILLSVFFTTAYVASALMAVRSSLSSATVRPRYSVSRTAVELRKFSVSSATDASLFAMALLKRGCAGSPWALAHVSSEDGA